MTQPLRALIVEDNEHDAELLLRELRRAGYAVTTQRVDTAPAMAAALAATTWDLVLSDYSMPEFGALAALELLKESGHDLPFLIVSGTVGEETAVACLRAGAHDFLVKGRLARLPSAIERELRAAQGRAARRQDEQRRLELEAARNAAERARRDSEQRFRQIAENISEVFWMTDVHTRHMLYVSPAYELIWGRSCASLQAQPDAWLDAVHPDDRERVREAMATKQQRGDYDETYRIVRPDGGTRWVRDRAFPIRDDQGAVFRIAGIAGDITEYRRLEDQFRQAQKMEAIGTLAGGIAHDFNNILAAITGFTALARAAAATNAEALEHLDEVDRAGTRAAELVRQILAFSRQQEQARVPLQLRVVAAEALRLLRATLPATVQFRSTLPSDLPWVLADATQVHQVLMNLGTNAWHAMREHGGVLEVRLEDLVVNEEAREWHGQVRPGRFVRLSVSDTGHGMDEPTRQRIFEPFFTTKAPGEGTGLGLSVVHGIMQHHDGAVTVYSEENQGTTFHLYFPATDVRTSDPVMATEATPRGNGQRILVVDDEEALARLGRKMLEHLGYTADVCTSPDDALAAVRREPARFALVLTDYTMPVMTGMDLANRLLAVRPDLPILLTSGSSLRLADEQLAAMGIGELLLKPTTVHRLGLAVHRLLDGKPAGRSCNAR